MARPEKGSGRITAKGTHREGDSPAPHHGRHSPAPSPRWLGAGIALALALGVASIFLNYLGALLPGAPSNVWLMVGLGLLLVGIVGATQYR